MRIDTPKETSPYGLIQEEFRDEPWKLLVCCICLNLTSIKQVRPFIANFFRNYPTPEIVASAKQHELAILLKPLGLYNRRTKALIKMSQCFCEKKWSRIQDVPGIGKYAADSWRIFVEGKLDVVPTDAKLIKYIEWARTHA